MARLSPKARRETIVAAALAVMQRKGIAATTVRDIAAELGTSSGLIHHYVASMDNLLAEAFGRVASDDLAVTSAAVAVGVDPIEKLRLFFHTYIRADGDTGMQLWLDAWAEAARRPALQAISRQLNQDWQQLLCDIIGQGQVAGVMHSDDPPASAWRILSLLDGLLLQTVAHGDAITAEQAGRWSRYAAENELGLPIGSLGATMPECSGGPHLAEHS